MTLPFRSVIDSNIEHALARAESESSILGIVPEGEPESLVSLSTPPEVIDLASEPLMIDSVRVWPSLKNWTSSLRHRK